MPEIYSLDEQLVQQLPLPLAQLCRRAQNAHTFMERHHAAFYLWEAALKLLASVAVIAYADLSDHDPNLAERLRKLARPSLGHWWEFVRRLVPVLADGGDAGFVAVRDLILGRAREDLPRAAGLDSALLETLDDHSGGRSTVRLTELLDRLVRYRNREFGHGAMGQRPATFYDDMSRPLLAGAAEVLGQLDVLAGRRLLYIGEVRKQSSCNWLVERYALHGESPKRMESLELSEGETPRLPRPERVYLEATDGGGRSSKNPGLQALHPLVHFEVSTGRVYFLNARRGKREIEYLCYSSGATVRREEMRADHRELLARVLNQPVDAEAADAWSAASQAEEPAAASTETDTPLRDIGGFELLSRLGQGGMGVVYRAWQPSLGRQVALKCMFRVGDPTADARFLREIHALGRVEHPNVVKVFTSGSDGDQWFYAMELIEGAELSRVCEQLAASSAVEIDEGRWRRALTTACERARSQETQLSSSQVGSVRSRAAATATPDLASATRPSVPLVGRGHVIHVVEITRQIAEAVHALHEAGVVHRDIKPGNIMLPANESAHPVLMDLGLAQLADETDGRLTRTRQFVGTLRYASPEQVLAAGRVDRRTDVYSLGATLWELLTLRPLFGATDSMPTPDLMLKIQTTDPESPRKYNNQVPRDLNAIVLKCLEKDRSRRYPTAAELADDLGRFLAGEVVLAQPPSLSYLTSKFVRRYRVPLATAIGILFFVIVLTIVAFLNIMGERDVAAAARDDLQRESYANRIAVAEREITLNQDINVASAALETVPPALRGWEWRYLMRLRDGSQPILRVNKGVWMVVFSPDGSLLASSGIDGMVRIWDVASQTFLRSLDIRPPWLQPLGKDLPVLTVAFSPNGRFIAAGSMEPNLRDLRNSKGVVKVWETSTWKEVCTFDQHMGLVTCLAFSSDSNYIASASLNKDNSFIVWEAKTGRPIVPHPLQGHTGSVNQLRFSPKDPILVSASTDGTLRLWDTVTFKMTRTIEAHPATVHDVAFSPDGSRLVSAGMDGTTRVWNASTGERLLLLRGHTGSALGVAVNRDGSRIATAGFDNTVRLWDAGNGDEKITLRGHHETVWSVAFSPDGQKLASGSFDKTVRIWDASPVETGIHSGSFDLTGDKGRDERVNRLAYSPDGRYIATGGWDAIVRIWDTHTRKAIKNLEAHKTVVWAVAYSPDGKRLASASWDGTVKVWDVARGIELYSCSHSIPVHSVAFSPDGARLASGCWDGLVKIWNANDGKELFTCDEHLMPALCLAFSSDSKRLASGSGDHNAIIWDVATGKQLLRCVGHEAAVHGVAFSPNGTELATAGWDKTVRVWDVTKGLPATLGDLGKVPRCRQVFATPKRVKENDEGHDDRVHSVAYSPDGNLIASASDDKTVRFWDAGTGKQQLAPLRHRGWVWSVAFCPDKDKHQLAAACWTTGAWVRVWDLNASP